MKIYISTVIYENSAHFLRFGEQGISYLDGHVVVPPKGHGLSYSTKALDSGIRTNPNKN